MPKYIGIVGSRRRNSVNDYKLVRDAVTELYRHGDYLVSGGCKEGADSFVQPIADYLHIDTDHVIIYLPDKSQLDPHLLNVNPRLAWTKINYARNTLIAEKSTHLIACVAADRKGGTEDTIKKFGKPIPSNLAPVCYLYEANQRTMCSSL